MHVLAVYLLISVTVVLSQADCGCGPKCSIYADAAKCTRCCTAIVKRSLNSIQRRAHRILLPTTSAEIYEPTLFQRTPQRPPKTMIKGRFQRVLEKSILDQILADSINFDI